MFSSLSESRRLAYLQKILESTFLSFRPTGEIFSNAYNIRTIKASLLCSE
jgi:hypothetical protein